MLFLKYFIGRSINEYYDTVLFTFGRMNSRLGIPVKSINKGTSEILRAYISNVPIYNYSKSVQKNTPLTHRTSQTG